MARRYVRDDGSLRDQRWYKGRIGEPIHDSLVSFATTLQANSKSFQSKNRARERIYEGVEISAARDAVAALETMGARIARLNATKSIIDTFVSRLGKDRVMPQFDTTDGDWDLKQRARKYRSFIVGEMKATEFDDLSHEALLDAGILGNGFTRIDADENDVIAERIHVNEMLFDERETRYGKPSQAVRVHRCAKDYLSELFPKFADAIDRAEASAKRPDDDRSLTGKLDDYVDVYEGWYLPCMPDSDVGRHALCISTGTLVMEEWLEPRFPWAHLRLFKPRVGFWGSGFVDQLASLQHRVNCIVRDLQLNIAATGRGFFMVNEANDIPVEQLSGWQPFKMKFKGNQPPSYIAPTMFNPAQLQALEFFIKKMFDLSGVSESAATSKSSLGPGASGVALDTQYDIDSDRFRLPQTNYARYRLSGAQCYIDAAKRVARNRDKAKGEKRSYVVVSWKNRDAIEKLEFNKVKLEEGTYKLSIEASNFIPDTRAGKLSVVEQLAKAGVIPQWLVPTLFDDPDLQQANLIMLSAFRNCMRKMDDLIDPDEPMPVPADYNDLELELKIVLAFINYMECERAPDEIVDRYRQYKDLVVEMQKKNKPAPAMAPPMAPAEQPVPGGVPAMPQGPVPAPTPIGAPMPPQMAA